MDRSNRYSMRPGERTAVGTPTRGFRVPDARDGEMEMLAPLRDPTRATVVHPIVFGDAEVRIEHDRGQVALTVAGTPILIGSLAEARRLADALHAIAAAKP